MVGDYVSTVAPYLSSLLAGKIRATSAAADRIASSHETSSHLNGHLGQITVPREPDDPVSRVLDGVQKPAGPVVKGLGDGDVDFVVHGVKISNRCSYI